MTMGYLVSNCLLPLLILSACAVDRQQPASSEKERDPSFWCVTKLAAGKGRIWIYRTAPKGLGLPPDIVVNNKLYEALRPGTAYTIDVAPGKHQVMLAYHKDKLEIEVTAGDDAFVRFDIDHALFGRGFYPVLVVRQTAQAELHQNTGTDFSCVKD
jgi:hypothetical protein